MSSRREAEGNRKENQASLPTSFIRDNRSAISENHLKPNHQLTQDERNAKRELKRLLKRQARRKKLETRLHQAIVRKDEATEKVSREELAQFLEEEQSELEMANRISMPVVAVQQRRDNNFSPEQEACSESDHCENQARDQIERIYVSLQKSMKERQHTDKCDDMNRNRHASEEDNSRNSSTKDFQTAEARLLLQNMTKGTQTVDMFENRDALQGYTRQKFQERANLSLSSLCKLDPRRWPIESSLNPELYAKLWERLSSGAIRSICSVGCGPGCDATGLVSFFQCFSPGTNDGDNNDTVLDRVLFLDWTMERWKFVVQPLVEDIFVPNRLLKSSRLAFCDVRKSLFEASNYEARSLLLEDSSTSEAKGSCCIDFFVTSYLLTETRGKWHDFYKDLIHIAKPGVIFLFAEPTAWQLHILRSLSEQLDFFWLDSAMYLPKLQALEGRVGPGVLLGMKR